MEAPSIKDQKAPYNLVANIAITFVVLPAMLGGLALLRLENPAWIQDNRVHPLAFPAILVLTPYTCFGFFFMNRIKFKEKNS